MKSITRAATDRLERERPECSASGVLSPTQTSIAFGLVASLAFALFLAPFSTIVALNALVALYFLLAAAYRLILMTVGWRTPVLQGSGSAPLAPNDLPIITILAPLYKDAEALASLSRSIEDLDYPPEKKDVILLLEADDRETRSEARRLGLNHCHKVICMPPIGPKTKPKACNIGLYLARGELIVIYDAEDQPEKDQLLKAAAAFQDADASLACVQCRLNYYNREENWLTRLFTLEYALWFDWLLPALQKLRAPIPLGGTSNFFRTRTLIEAGGWDPHNVTEDADLGLRLSRLGYRVEMLDSTTFEEANCRLGNWLRQRSRWIKGHLQTWLVHMRRPGEIVSTTGRSGLLSVQLFLAGNVFSALINPLLWAMFILLDVFDLGAGQFAVPAELKWLNLTSLIAGNALFVTFAAMAPIKRGWRRLCVYGLTAPIYWLLASLAAYKAVWQIVFRPHYWEKTDHVISNIAIRRRLAILQGVAN